MKKKVLALLLVAVIVGAAAIYVLLGNQPEPTQRVLSIEWQRYLPGISGVSVIQTSDRGYLALGQNASIDNVSGEFVNYTSIAVKTDASGNAVWAKTYSIAIGITTTRLTNAVETSDGYVLQAPLLQQLMGFLNSSVW